MDNHKLEIEELERRASNLHAQITSTRHQRTKKSLIHEKSTIDLKITHLKGLKNQTEEEQYNEKLQTLITENRAFIFFSANGERILIDKKGNVEFTFTPCNHKKTMQISNLQLHTHENNRIKFDTWRRLLKENVTYDGMMNCLQCRRDKEKKFQTLRRRTNEPIPRLRWELRALR